MPSTINDACNQVGTLAVSADPEAVRRMTEERERAYARQRQENARIEALRLANTYDTPIGDVLKRAKAYAKFLTAEVG